MCKHHTACVRAILSQDIHARIEQRDEFFEIVTAGLQATRKQRTAWVAKEVFFNTRIDELDLEEVVDQLGMHALQHLLDQLDGTPRPDGTPQHHAYQLRETETLGQYCIRVAERDNIPRNARHKLTIHEVDKTTQEHNGRPLLLFMQRADLLPAESETGAPGAYVDKIGTSQQISTEAAIDAMRAFQQLDDEEKLAYLLREAMPQAPTRATFIQLAQAAHVTPGRIAEAATRLEQVLGQRKTRLCEKDIAQILAITVPELRRVLATVTAHLNAFLAAS